MHRLALKKVGTYVDIEFETREHAMFVINNFTPSDFHLKLAPSNITGLPMICPREVYLRSRRRDHTPDSVEDSVSLPWNNPLPTEWRIPANSVGDLLRAYPTHPQSIRRDPIDPVKPFEESLWPSLY